MQESVIYQEIVKEARQEGIQQGRQEVALNLLRGGINVEQVVAYTDLSEEIVQELQRNIQQ